MQSELAEEDIQRLEAQRNLIRGEVRVRYGEELCVGRQAFAQLQRLLDDKAYMAAHRYALQSIGVCWGDVLCSVAPFRWVMITDEYGHDPTLQWKQTSINIYALTMISKRVENGEEVDVEWLAGRIIERAEELETEADEA